MRTLGRLLYSILWKMRTNDLLFAVNRRLAYWHKNSLVSGNLLLAFSSYV